jgi:lipid-A-disaccharide synthase
MNYYLIAGEASGDLHASNLMKTLKNIDKKADFRFFGGNLMQAVGGYMVKHYREMAYMGFIPVLLHLRTILENLNLCREDIREYQPDVVILVDYPGFNLKIAKYVATQLHIPLLYYIPPKVWAWKTYRVGSIRKYVDSVLSIFPFEADFYQKHHCRVEYVGNPTVDAIAENALLSESFNDFIEANRLSNRPIIAILAGSRKQEIKDNLPAMLNAASSFPGYQVLIAGAPGIEPEYYRSYIEDKPVEIVFNQTYRLLRHSAAALVTSGTATLETSLLRVPQVVCYRTPIKRITGFVFRHFFHVKYISLVNLIAEKAVVRELFADSFSEKNILSELDAILNNQEYRRQMLHGYDEIIRRLGKPGASRKAGRLIYNAVVEAQQCSDKISQFIDANVKRRCSE